MPPSRSTEGLGNHCKGLAVEACIIVFLQGGVRVVRSQIGKMANFSSIIIILIYSMCDEREILSQ